VYIGKDNWRSTDPPVDSMRLNIKGGVLSRNNKRFGDCSGTARYREPRVFRTVLFTHTVGNKAGTRNGKEVRGRVTESKRAKREP